MRNKRKGFALLGVLLAALMLLSGCVRVQRVAQQAEPDGETADIGLTVDSFVIERWQRDRDVFVSAAKERGMEVIVQDAGGSLDEQIEQIRYFIRRGARAIVIVATDCNGLSGVIAEAKAAGIRVIAYDRLVRNADIDLYVSFDSERVGALMAECIVERTRPGGQIICINGSESDYNVELIQKGFHSVIDTSGLEIIYNGFCPNWEAQDAYEIMQELLDAGTAFDAVMCGNDDLAAMVYRALAERALMDGVCLVGQDAELSACQRVVSGWQSMTVYKQVESMARKAAYAVCDMLEGKPVDAQATMDNGLLETPAILLTPVAVTAENMDDVIIAGGFHTRAGVYANQLPQ